MESLLVIYLYSQQRRNLKRCLKGVQKAPRLTGVERKGDILIPNMTFFRVLGAVFFCILSCFLPNCANISLSPQPIRDDGAGMDLMSHLRPGSCVGGAVFIILQHLVSLNWAHPDLRFY